MQKDPDNDEDTQLFRTAVAGVRRLTATHRRPEPAKPLSTRPRRIEGDQPSEITELPTDQEPALLEAGEILLYRSEGVQDGVMRKLKRGQYRIETELDLHGCTREKARLLVAQFLAHCQQQGQRCIRIIHGKGHGSANNGAILKSHVASWLRQRKEVIAYCSARPVDGGTGAVYVLLRANSTSS